MAALKKINSNASMPTTGRSASGSSVQGKMNTPALRRTATGSVSQGVASETMDKSSTNLGPVEMDAILPMESKPPTLTPIYNNSQPSFSLTGSVLSMINIERSAREKPMLPRAAFTV